MIDPEKLDGYLAPDIARAIIEFKEGGKVGEPCRIDAISKLLSWYPGFLNCFTGFAGAGKSGFITFLMLVKAFIDDWKFAIWSPEMIDTIRGADGRLHRSARRIYNPLIHSLTGKNPYKHVDNQMTMDEYQEAFDWVERHFFVIDTWRDKTPEHLIKLLHKAHESFEFNAFLIDPFKNLTIDESKMTKDRVMESVFDKFEEFTLNTDTIGNFIAHPRNMDEKRMRVNGKLNGPYKVVNQHDLLGGSAWDNSMDGIFTYHRQEKHSDPNSPKGSFYSLKQKSQELTRTELGYFDGIYFDKKTNRFYFNDVCPLDGSILKGKQEEIKFDRPYDAIKKARQKKETPPPPDNEPPF